MGQWPEFECHRGKDRGAAPMRVGGVWREEGAREDSGMWGWVSRSPLGAGLGVLCLLQKQKSILHLK